MVVLEEQQGAEDVEHVISNIKKSPENSSLETALPTKRARITQPSKPTPRSRPRSPSLRPSPSTSSAAQSPASCSKPSLTKFVECGDKISDSLPVSPRQDPSPPPPGDLQTIQDEDIILVVNDGSDEELDKSDEEMEKNGVSIPRVFRSMMKMLLNHGVADKNTVGGPATVTDLVHAGKPAPNQVPQAVPEELSGLHIFDWKEFPKPSISPGSRREKFSEINVGPKTPSVNPLDIFIEIWDHQIMEHIAWETNKYAQQVVFRKLKNQNLHPRSRISRWVDTTVEELYTLFGLILAMGIVVKTRIEEYWNSAPDIFCTPGFGAHMSIDRFLILNKCLHFNNNDDMCSSEMENSEARLFKIQPILTHLNKKFQQMYTPAQNIVVNESILMWKDWLDIAQFVPSKAASRDIKAFEVCESHTGYLWRFEVRKNMQPQADPLEDATTATVLQLIQGLEHKGYTIWMDDYFQSPCLARRLKCLGFDCAGTLRTDRNFVPQALNSLTEKNMRPGQMAGLTSGDVDILVWRDTNRVAMISTYHGDCRRQVRGHTKPTLISDYNTMMGGVDKKDQLLAMYPVERKRTQVWYKIFFRRLLNVSVLNAHIIHRYRSSTTHRDFRIGLIKSLLSKNCTPSPIPRLIARNKVDVTHRLGELPMGNHQRMRRACTACSKQVRTFCVGCGNTVCMDPCFLLIHS